MLHRIARDARRIGAVAALLACAGAAAACGSAVPITGLASAAATPCATPGPPSTKDTFSQQVTLKTAPSGLRYADLAVGCGPVVKTGSGVTIQYTAWLSSGKEIATSRAAGAQPAQFIVGSGQLITGLEDGVLGMHVGGKRRLVLPPQLAFGPQGRPPVVPPNATIVFDVEVTSLQ